MLLVHDIPGTSAVAGVPSITITAAAGIVRIVDAGSRFSIPNASANTKQKIKTSFYNFMTSLPLLTPCCYWRPCCCWLSTTFQLYLPLLASLLLVKIPLLLLACP
jgi:hypothetical protein